MLRGQIIFNVLKIKYYKNGRVEKNGRIVEMRMNGYKMFLNYVITCGSGGSGEWGVGGWMPT